MGTATFKFNFEGNKESLMNKIETWLTTTTEGKRYSKKNPAPGSFLKIQRGKGFWTAPIVIEFDLLNETGSATEILVKGYVVTLLLFLIPIGRASFSESAKIGGLPRRNGWKDMMKILDFLNVKEYELGEI